MRAVCRRGAARGVARGLRAARARAGRLRAIGGRRIDRVASSTRPARTNQPPPTLISNHPTP